MLPERCHLRGGESDDSYERSCMSGPFPLPSQYSEERKLTQVLFFSTLQVVVSLIQNHAFSVSIGMQDKIFQSICFPAHATQGMALVRGDSPRRRASSTLVHAQKVFSQAQQAFLAGCCEYAVPAFHAKFQWGTTEFCINNTGSCEGKGPDFVLAEVEVWPCFKGF